MNYKVIFPEEIKPGMKIKVFFGKNDAGTEEIVIETIENQDFNVILNGKSFPALSTFQLMIEDEKVAEAPIAPTTSAIPAEDFEMCKRAQSLGWQNCQPVAFSDSGEPLSGGDERVAHMNQVRSFIAEHTHKHLKVSGTFQKPAVLLHDIGGGRVSDGARFEADVDREGLKPVNRWEDINALLPQRPRGVFFWNADEDAATPAFPRYIDVADLDEEKLFAFPSLAAVTADKLVVLGAKTETLGEFLDADGIKLMNSRPVPYADYDGSFAAEWIYAGNVPAYLLRKSR